MEILRQIRVEAGHTLQYVSEKTGLSISYLQELETGKAKNPSFATVTTLGDFFHAYRDEVHKEARRIPKDIFFKITDSEKSFEEIRKILDTAGV